jgi:hypothetical protein
MKTVGTYYFRSIRLSIRHPLKKKKPTEFEGNPVHALCTHAGVRCPRRECQTLPGRCPRSRRRPASLLDLVFRLIKEADQTLNLISGLLAELADSAEKLLTLEPGRKLKLPRGLLLGYPIFVAKSIRHIPKKKRRGRPPTGGRREGLLVRLEAAQFDALDAWISRQDEPNLSRPEAIRRLIELGLTAKTKAKPTGRLRAALVADLAAETIDPLPRADRPKRKT